VWKRLPTTGHAFAVEGSSSQSPAFVYNLGFPGQYFDRESQLYYNGFRDYDPFTGRYVESDPLGLLAGVNTYAYVNGNPLSIVDSLGLLPGHHIIPKQIFKRYNFPPETQKVFDKGTTDPVTHYFDKGHRAYNKAVQEAVDKFLKDHNINPEDMTPEQATECIRSIEKSQEPSIMDYLNFLRNGGGLFRAPILFCPLCSYIMTTPDFRGSGGHGI